MREFSFIISLLCCLLICRMVCGQNIMRIFYKKAKGECYSNQFRCVKDGTCIDSYNHCDGKLDCDDKSDEAHCPSEGCSHGTFFCKRTFKCIPANLKCNGKNDCLHGEDEHECQDKGPKCVAGQFHCSDSNECIDESKVCDQKVDCHHGTSDENHDSCVKVGRPYFKKSCEPGKMLCAHNNRCLDEFFKCDNFTDCPDGSDEKFCPDRTRNDTCAAGSYYCSDHTCIPASKECDGVNDCHDGADENDCFKCEKGEHQCENQNKCFNSSQICDKKKFCDEGTDEKNCTDNVTTTTTIKPVRKVCDPETQFDCDKSGKECIPLSKVCDYHDDCSNKADENLASCKKDICRVDNGGCSHTCTYNIDLKQHKCSCPAGFRLNRKDNRTCLDINECEQWDICSQSCTNLNGTYSCGCSAGFLKPHVNSSKCVLKGEKSLMFSAQKNIRQYKFSMNELLMVNNLADVVGFDIDQTSSPRVIYWSVAAGKIGRLSLTNSEPKPEVLVQEEDSVPDGLMFDWTNNLLYWTDTGLNRIMVMNVSNGHKAVLLEGKPWLDEPRAIIVDPESGMLYWSDWGSNEPRISRMGMDGQNMTVLLDKKTLQQPNALALDSARRRLYYGDAKLGKIGCLDLHTGMHRNIIVDKTYYPFSMIVFEDRIYWSDWRNNAIFSADKFTGKDIYKVASTFKPLTLRMISQAAKQKVQGLCFNNDCSHICMPSGKESFTCGCPVNMKLSQDRKTCKMSKILVKKPSKQIPSGSNMILTKDDITTDVGFIAGITIGIIITVSVVAVILGITLYMKYAKRMRTRTIHFDNAGLIKTSEDLFALTRSNSSMRSMKTVPSSSQPLWTYQTNNDIMEDMIGSDIKV